MGSLASISPMVSFLYLLHLLFIHVFWHMCLIPPSSCLWCSLYLEYTYLFFAWLAYITLSQPSLLESFAPTVLFLVPLLCTCRHSCSDLRRIFSFSPPRNNCPEDRNNVWWVLPPTCLALGKFSWMAYQEWVVRWPFGEIFSQGSSTESGSYINILINIVLAVFPSSSISS